MCTKFTGVSCDGVEALNKEPTPPTYELSYPFPKDDICVAFELSGVILEYTLINGKFDESDWELIQCDAKYFFVNPWATKRDVDLSKECELFALKITEYSCGLVKERNRIECILEKQIPFSFLCLSSFSLSFVFLFLLFFFVYHLFQT